MNPAVEKLLTNVVNPVLRSELLTAFKSGEPIVVENLPDELLAPVFMFASVAREFGLMPVNNFGLLRKRTDEDGNFDSTPEIVTALLSGASFSEKPKIYSEAARLNCAPDEVRISHLPIGARFRITNPYSGGRTGTLVDKSPCRAVVEWDNTKTEKTFKNNKTGQEVTISTAASTKSSCDLETPVVPLHSTIAPEDHAWVTNAYKELTGAFEEPVAKKGKRTSEGPK